MLKLNSMNGLNLVRVFLKKIIQNSVCFVIAMSALQCVLILTCSDSYALYTPTLSASLNNSNAEINGNQILNSADKVGEYYLDLAINTNNKTGYTASLSTESDNTALVNTTSSSNSKINSISSTLPMSSLPNNTWGYRTSSESDYHPIPALSSPVNVFHSEKNTTGSILNQLKIGLKLNDNLETGSYQNKLIFSIVTNPYSPQATLVKGTDFNSRINSLMSTTNRLNHFKRSLSAPSAGTNTVNLEDEDDSEFEIKAWYNASDKTVYYHTDTDKIYLNKNCKNMFSGYSSSKFRNIMDIDLTGLDSRFVEDMDFMFFGLEKISNLNLSNFDTSNVKTMNSTFVFTTNLATLDLSMLNTANVTDMNAMFANMRNLSSLNLGGSFSTKNTNTMINMFMNASRLENLDLSTFNTSNVTNMSGMFSGMENLKTLNISSFDTRNVTNMRQMFSTDISLTSLDLSNFQTAKVTDMGAMFNNNISLSNLNISSFNTGNVTDMAYMFAGVEKITSLNLSHFDTGNVIYTSGMFHGMSNLVNLDISHFNTSKVQTMGNMFSNLPKIKTIDLSSFSTESLTSVKEMFLLADGLTDSLERIYASRDFNLSQIENGEDTNIFTNRRKLRGGNGSFMSNPADADKSWLRIDRPGAPGYFTQK